MVKQIRIEQFLDSEGRITQLPTKLTKKLAVYEYLTEKFEMGKIYTEKQVNEICAQWHTFGDYILLRRELIDYGYLSREGDGTKYWRVWVRTSEEL